MRVSAVDLFCGAGGLSHGMITSGIEVVAGYDVDENCRFPFEHNNNSRFMNMDINLVSSKEVSDLLSIGDVKVLMGCAPCQPFSTYNISVKRGKNDNDWSLLDNFARLVAEVKPDIVSMENVPQIVKTQVFHDFAETLRFHDYSISYGSHFAPDYGVPQARHRLILLASRLGNIELIPPTCKSNEYRTVRQTIGDLERISAGEVSKKDPLHRSAKLNDTNLERIRASLPGGSWKDWEMSLRANCHRKQSGESFSAVYSRMEWDKPAPTITTQFYGYGNGRFGHPEQDRALSLREGALLQTFPENYQFVKPEEPVRFKAIGKLIGNAVPVLLASAIGRSIIKHLGGRYE